MAGTLPPPSNALLLIPSLAVTSIWTTSADSGACSTDVLQSCAGIQTRKARANLETSARERAATARHPKARVYVNARTPGLAGHGVC